eukprot:3472250-Rhodomonas_salina.3
MSLVDASTSKPWQLHASEVQAPGGMITRPGMYRKVQLPCPPMMGFEAADPTRLFRIKTRRREQRHRSAHNTPFLPLFLHLSMSLSPSVSCFPMVRFVWAFIGRRRRKGAAGAPQFVSEMYQPLSKM